MDVPDEAAPWPPPEHPGTPPPSSTMASSPPYQSPRPSSEEQVQVQAPPPPPAEQDNTANERPPRVPFWNESLVTTYNRIPQPVRPWWTGWSGYEGAAIGTGFTKGIKPVNAVQPHLPLRPLMTDVDPSKCFSTDDLAIGTTKHIFSRSVPVKLSKRQKTTLSGWFSGTRKIYNHAVDSLNMGTMPPDLSMLEKAFSTDQTEAEVVEKTRKRLAAQGLTNGPRKSIRLGAGQRSTFNTDMLTGNQWETALEEEKKEKVKKNVPRFFPYVDPQYSSGHLLSRYPELKELPSVVRQDAVRDAIKAVNSMEARFRKGYKVGKLHFRKSNKHNSATLGTQSIRSHGFLAPDPQVKRNGTMQKKVYTTIQIGHDFGEVSVRQQLPEEAFEHGISFSRCKRGKYYLRYHLHITKKHLPALCRPAEREVIGLDPGVRSFMTRYDADSGAHYNYSSEKLFELADKARTLVRQVSAKRKELQERKRGDRAAGMRLRFLQHSKSLLCENLGTALLCNATTCWLDPTTHEGTEMQTHESVMGKEERRTALLIIRQLKAQQLKASERVSNFRNNFHKQVAAHLCAEEGRTIVLPEFRVSQMVARENPETGAKRKLRQVTARKMLILSHYKFRSYMKHKAIMSGCELLVVTEEYTTMTCGGCGHLNRSVGGKKVFKCNSADCYNKDHPADYDYLERCGREKAAHVQLCQYESGRDESAARNIILKQVKNPLPEEFLAN